ncbi:MAG: sulfotransferase [Rhizomicrobium sp.]
MAAIKRFKLEDEQLTVLENLRGRSAALSKDERVELHYALAKAREDLGQHDVAFRHLMEGSGIKRQLVRYDERSSLALFDRIARVFTKDFLQQKSGVGDLSQVPIFIVGMPRSGTTLVEQVLASHPSVFGAGELSHLRNEAMGVHDRDQTSAFPEDMASWPKEAFTALGERYIDHLRTHAPAALRITDKMPANFRFLGLIHLALPKARIIHVKRSAVDTCFSCFFNVVRRNTALYVRFERVGPLLSRL